VNELRARELVARERARIESALAELGGEIRAEGSLGRQQPGDRDDAGSARETESVSVALTADLREQLAAVERAEERITRGTYGRSVESGYRSRTSDSRCNPWPSEPYRSNDITSGTGPSSKVDRLRRRLSAAVILLVTRIGHVGTAGSDPLGPPTRGSPAACVNGSGGAAYAGLWPRSGGSARASR